MNPDKIKTNFNNHANSYNNNAIVQKIIAEKLFDQIDKYYSKINSSILEIGCGTGFLTDHIIKYYNPEKLLINDLSDNMISEIKIKFSNKNIEYISGDFLTQNIKNSFNLICSGSTFQWFIDLNYAIAKIHDLLDNQGILGFTIFSEGTFKELDDSFRKTYTCLNEPYQKHILDFISIDKLETIIKNNGFRLKNLFEKEYIYNFKSPFDFLKSIKAIGAGGVNEKPVNVKIMRNMSHFYKKLFTDEKDQVKATYKVIFCIAEKI